MSVTLNASATTEDANLFRLKASVQEYEWGKAGDPSQSLVAKFAKAAIGSNYDVKEDKTYAEIWMGTHKNGPAHLWDRQKTSLQEFISTDPVRLLGSSRGLAHTSPEASLEENTTHLPFLFKILSIAKALPLQAHPDRELGKKLHSQNSIQFVDANHKPEIAVALKDGFRGFVGFKPASDIKPFVRNIPELRDAIGNLTVVDVFLNSLNPDSEHIRALFSALLSQPQRNVNSLVDQLITRIDKDGFKAFGDDIDPREAKDLVQVVKKLHSQYPGDVGVLAAPFFMNLITLKKGESVYIGADEAHAYLEGDIIECMAISDNVLNSAFVPPKERDTQIFLSALTYTSRPPNHYILPREKYTFSSTGKTTKFDPPLEEFTVIWTLLGDDATSDARAGPNEVLNPISGPSIGIVTEGSVVVEISEGQGKGEVLSLNEEGSVFFVGAGNEITIRPQTGSPKAEIWWAVCAD